MVKVSEVFITKSFVRCGLITKSSADRSGSRRQWWQICSEGLLLSHLQIGVALTRISRSDWSITKSLRNSVVKVLAVFITKSLVQRLLRNFVVKVLEVFVTKSFVRGLINRSSVDSSVLRRQW